MLERFQRSLPSVLVSVEFKLGQRGSDETYEKLLRMKVILS